MASTLSGAGSSVTAVAVPLLAITVLHSSTFAVSALSAAGQAGWLLLGLPAGVLIQGLRLQRLQVALDTIRAVAMFSVPIAWALGLLSYWQLIVVALVVGLATVLFSAANSGFINGVVPKTELMSKNSLMTGTDAVISTAGPGLAGLLVQLVGPVIALFVDAVSYLASAVVMRTLPERLFPPKESSSMLGQIRDGFAYVVRHPVMFPCMLFATTFNFVEGGVNAVAPLYLVRGLGSPALLVGIMLACTGFGAFVGSAIATRVARRVGTARAVLLGALVSAAAVLLLPATWSLQSLPLFALGNFGFAAGGAVGSIVTRTHRMTDSPPDLLSRVMATVRFVSWGVIPIGALVTGAIAVGLGPRLALLIVCALASVGFFVLLLSPVRSRRELSDLVDDSE